MTRTLRTVALAGAVAGSLALSGCDLTELNDDPNNPTEATTAYFLTNAQVDVADTFWGSFNNGRFALLYAQYWTQNQYTDEDRYRYRETISSDLWNSLYLDINNLEQIVRLVEENPEGYQSPQNQVAVARIMQAFSYHILTDVYGDIPYSEALQGREAPSPAYDAQEDVYVALLASLTEAQASIDVAGTVPGDVIYGGDAGKWKRFANSLKMRIAMRMVDRMPQQAAAAIQEALAAGPMASVDDAAVLAFQPSQPYSNPIWENYNISGRDDWAVTDALVEELADDPRLPIYADPTPASANALDPAYVGLDYGLSGGVAAAVPRASFSRPGTGIRTQTSPAIFMLYDEVLFIQAEAAARGLVPGNADALFAQAVAANMAYWGVDADDAEDYVDTLPALTAGNYVQVLGVEKWLALYLQGIQGWAEWRRLDFTGVLEAPAGGALVSFPGDIAVRLPYPTQEQTLNADNLAAAVASQGADNQGTKLWWDVD